MISMRICIYIWSSLNFASALSSLFYLAYIHTCYDYSIQKEKRENLFIMHNYIYEYKNGQVLILRVRTPFSLLSSLYFVCIHVIIIHNSLLFNVYFLKLKMKREGRA